MEQRRSGRLRAAACICAMVLLLLLLAALWRSGLLQKMDSVEELRALIDGSGAFAWAVYFVVQLLTVIVAPIPSNMSMLAGAIVLGLWPALLLGLAAIWLGSMLVFFAARVLGQRAVQRFVDGGMMDKYLPVIKEKQEVFLFLALLFPFFPDDVLCILAGLTTIPAVRFAGLVLLARPWGLAFAALLGSGALHVPLWGWAVLLPLLCVLFALAMKHSVRIENWLFAHLSTIEKRKKE